VIAATWPWVVLGVAGVIVLGGAFVLVVGVAGMPGDFLRRLVQSATARPSDGGVELPEEVPEATAEDAAREAAAPKRRNGRA
jgi:hypothetical protein